jgi:hypothetical protein
MSTEIDLNRLISLGTKYVPTWFGWACDMLNDSVHDIPFLSV